MRKITPENDVLGKTTQMFLEPYTSEHTIHNYINALRKYFRFIGTSDDDYFKTKRNYEDDARRFFVSIKDNPPKSIRLRLSIIKTFLSENNIELSDKFWRGIRRKIPKNRALTMDEVPSNDELRSILTHMGARGKAIFLMLSSSGMRIGESVGVTLSDIHLDENPPRVDVRAPIAKGGGSRIAFISSEAKEAIGEWLKIRDNSIACAVGRSSNRGHDKSADDNRLFPYDRGTLSFIWNTALGKAGLDSRDVTTNWHKFHIHTLRKFFRTRMGAVISLDVTEALMGHEGYLTEAYRKYSREQLAEFYLKGEHSLLVFNDRNSVKRLETKLMEQIGRQAQEIDELKQSQGYKIGENLIAALQANPSLARELSLVLARTLRDQEKKE